MARKKRDVSPIVSGAGLLTAVWTALVKEVRAQGGSDEDIHRLGTPEGEPLIKRFAEIIVRAGREEPDQTNFTVTVRRAEIESLIKAGKYDWVNSDIVEENFPVTVEGESEVTVELIHFNRVMSTEAAEKELDKRDLRPATIEELLALGAEHTELQRKFPIIALGSSWQYPNGNRYVPYLYEYADKRSLDLRWIVHVWRGDCRFAAVRK